MEKSQYSNRSSANSGRFSATKPVGNLMQEQRSMDASAQEGSINAL